MITFSLRRTDDGWFVDQVKVEGAGSRPRVFQRGVAWTARARVEDLAAAMALLGMRATAGEAPYLSATLGKGEAALIRRCGTIIRSIKPGEKHWSIGLFGDYAPLSGHLRTPLENLYRVSGQPPSTMAPMPGYSGTSFRFLVDQAEASTDQIGEFVRSRWGTGRSGQRHRDGAAALPSTVPTWDIPLDTHPSELVKPGVLEDLVYPPSKRLATRVKTENKNHGMCLAVCGSRDHDDAPQAVIDRVVDALAKVVVRMRIHLITGPIGLGPEILDRAINEHGGRELTYSLVVGPSLHLVVAADACVVIGGGDRARAEVDVAVSRGTQLIPIRETGGAAATCWESMRGGATSVRLWDVHLNRLGSSDAITICEALDELLDGMVEYAKRMGPSESA